MFIKIIVLAALCLISKASFAQDFHGYDCTVDCSGHEAGYNWAQQNGITSESDCGGNSNSFIEGCKAFTEEDSGSSYAPNEDQSGDDIDEEEAEE